MNNKVELINAYLHITNACEFKCPFCYASDIKICEGKSFFETDKILKIIDIVGKSTIKNISLVGGNPILHPDIFSIMKYIKSTTNLNIILMTNTAEISLNKIEEYCSMIDVLMVTVHSNTPDMHDSITKMKNSYNNLMKALLKFQKINPLAKIKVAVNITPYAYDRIYSIAENVVNYGIKLDELVLQRIAPVSVDRMNEEFLVNATQANIALSQAIDVRDKLNVKVDLVDPFPLCFVDEKNKEIVVPCKCGKTDININGNGDVSRCGADPNYQLGNIFVTPISEIWNKPELVNFRNKDYLPEECLNCNEKYVCGGGCPMSVLAYKKINKSHLVMFKEKK